MNFSVSGLLAGVIFSSVGVGYFMFGKRQARVVHLVCGALLMVVPWFVTNLILLIGVGLLFTAAPIIAALWWGL